MSPSPRSRPSLSITLPNLEFPLQSSQLLPKTPEQRDEPQSSTQPPPRPQRETYPTYKVKRKRPSVPFQIPDDVSSRVESIIPTIETSEAPSETSSPALQPTSATQGLLSPLPSFQRLVTPPMTPATQVNPNFTQLESPAHEWALINNETRGKRPSLERSGSVCSSVSESSLSSYGSSGFSVPNAGSCTSPGSEATDPFMEDEKLDRPILSPQQKTSPHAKRVKRFRDVKWTLEMDQHLEATYIRYLHDPRVTPFKTLPGLAPPLGVCHRVASKARRTWTQCRVATPTPLDTVLEDATSRREGSPDTIRPDGPSNETPHGRQQPQWPRSDSATRRRLRFIVKRKPALSAHYQRLLHTRSPSPFTSNVTTARSSEPPPSSTSVFSSREMNMSLVTSTAPSMQPEGPLAQLASEDRAPIESHQKQPDELQRASRPADWFSRIGRSQAHQKSKSLQSQLSLETDVQPAGALASPFDGISSRSHLLQSMSTTKSLGRTDFQHGKKPSLDSPFEGAPTLPRSLKRRFKSDEDKPRRPGLEDVFGPRPDETVISRGRGFSVGAARATNNLAKMFEPPSSTTEESSPDYVMSEAPPLPEIPFGCRSAPRRLAEPIPRLGSPFVEMFPTDRQHNTFPRSYIPSSASSQPFQDRLRELAAQAQTR